MRKTWLSILAVALVTIAVSSYFLLQRQAISPNRPQEPKGPFPYKIEDVSFRNSTANITLSGTLTVPSSVNRKKPAVILISGSGPQNRDGEWFGHKPFLVIADHLTRQGIAVLRFDDRGFGKSTGDFHLGTSLDFSTDVESAVQFLKARQELDSCKIGLIGHSDGAMVASMVAARSSDVSFMVMLAGPGISGSELMVKRQVAWERMAGKSESEIQRSKEYIETLISIIVTAENENDLHSRLTKFGNENKEQIPADQIPPNMTKDEFISRQVAMLTSPWFKYFFTYDPRPTLEKVKCPVLVLNGDKDVQAIAADNLPAIKSALITGGNEDFSIKELQGLNHMFQECTTGMIVEYPKIEQTFSPLALNEISHWIIQKVNDDIRTKD
ncbi:alpha/beta hydrolase [Dawidia soli]|uniref:Alpha/beta hydrolase n=1 Tax=Dawidia soli TaxID=2782352 RepID=A0AAP2DBR8_9BACT|nr:alpha/beta hydrolase [Dawidia soli]MBT1688517.1 alpha/beta hydrolase [Dawidia soli]